MGTAPHRNEPLTDISRSLTRWHVSACIVAVSLFGPYLAGGVRTEQVAMYALLLASIPLLSGLRLPSEWVALVALWSCLFVVVVVVGISPPPSRFESGILLAGIDNYALPFAGLIVAAVWAQRRRIDALLTFASSVCWLLAANSVVAAISVVVGFPALLDVFWTADPTTGSVAVKAASNDRFSGIFNHPAESGTAYSFGLLLALWRWGWRESRPKVLVGALVLLVAGGLLSASKAFVFVGLPVFLVALSLDRRTRDRRLLMLGLFAATGGGALITSALPWAGQERLERLLRADNLRSGESTLLGYLTAGRLGDESTLLAVAAVVWEESPLYGYGASGLRVAYDSSWLELLIVGGAVGVSLFVAVILVLAHCALATRFRIALADWRLGVGFLIIMVGGSWGLPAHTANRTATILWIVLGLTILAPPDPRPFAKSTGRLLSGSAPGGVA